MSLGDAAIMAGSIPHCQAFRTGPCSGTVVFVLDSHHTLCHFAISTRHGIALRDETQIGTMQLLIEPSTPRRHNAKVIKPGLTPPRQGRTEETGRRGGT